ncbi:MAG: hypothetical protein JXK94_06170 [Deltaproteobacteria bacterium]|nr:hypothetical protein [Deltaproteobacteria bacterium]
MKDDLPLEQRPFYRKVSDREILRKAPVDHLYAFPFNNGTMNGKNPYRKALHIMKRGAPLEAAKKYENALGFLDRLSKLVVVCGRNVLRTSRQTTKG